MKIKLRHDLECIKRSIKLDHCWVIKDPVSFNHFMFSNHEFELLRLFDGLRSEQEIQRDWQQKFHTRSLTIDQIRQFAGRLMRDNLVSVEQFGYGGSLFARQSEQQHRAFKTLLLSPLVIRLRGVNPSVILDSVAWIGWLLFHPIFVVLAMCCAATVVGYMLGHFDELSYRMPVISQLLSTQGIVALAITLSIVKVLHELGHALACRRCGGECFEIGLIFLAFIPTLYCNVSDAWTFPERWKRLLVSFAGIYVEIILAALAAVLWMITEPGLFNSVMFNVVLLCSVNTLFINGNPLLRYDGYYLLSDLTEQPNLSTTARQELSDFVTSMFWDSGSNHDHPRWVLAYAVLSFFYRWFVLVSIILMVYAFMKSVGLRVVGQYFVAFLTISMLWSPLMASTFFRVRSGMATRGRFNFARATLSIAIASLFLAAFFYLPIPSHVRCNMMIEADSPTPVYAPAAAKLTSIVDNFSSVKTGSILAEFESIELEQQLRQVKRDLSRAQNLVKQLRLRVNEEPLVASQIAVTWKNIESYQSQLQVLEQEVAQLVVRSPRDGVVHAAPGQRSIFRTTGQPNLWQGQLTDPVNQNCFVERGEQLLSIERPDQKTITLLVGERDIDFVKSGQQVKLLYSQHPGRLFDGKVGEIFEVDVDMNDQHGVATGLQSIRDAAGNLKSLETPYRVTVQSPEIPDQAFVGSGGRARIAIPDQTLAAKIWRSLDRLVKFNL